LNSAARIKRERNQARDVRLKAESAGKRRVPDLQLESPGETTREKKGKTKEQVLEVEEERIRLERRMERAMAAAEEDAESGDTDDDSDVLMNEGEADSTTEEENEDTGGDEAEVTLNPDYLPEHYFEELVSPSKTSSALTKTKKPTIKRKRKAKDRIKQEEKVIGYVPATTSRIYAYFHPLRSRAIIKLASNSLSAVGRTTPSTNAKRFLHHRLKGDIRTKGWERRPGQCSIFYLVQPNSELSSPPLQLPLGPSPRERDQQLNLYEDDYSPYYLVLLMECMTCMLARFTVALNLRYLTAGSIECCPQCRWCIDEEGELVTRRRCTTRLVSRYFVPT
jgi:hypothetical protein